jgi:hypothetical protein
MLDNKISASGRRRNSMLQNELFNEKGLNWELGAFPSTSGRY